MIEMQIQLRQQQQEFHHQVAAATGGRNRQQQPQQEQEEEEEDRPQNLTKCSKMTTEGVSDALKNGGLNGGGAPASRNSTSSSSSSTSPPSTPFRPQYDIAQLMDSSTSSSSSSPKRLPLGCASVSNPDTNRRSSAVKHEHENNHHNSSSSKTNNESPPNSGASFTSGSRINGGRLQFFKDGKFILELASSREAENGRSGWVVVPRKIFWPPTQQGFNSFQNTSINKNESSASLSFSDDNSSIQSSPWQRDHCWKQTTPRRNISREMSLYYVRPRRQVRMTISGRRISQRKRRKPYDVSAPRLIRTSFRIVAQSLDGKMKTEVKGNSSATEVTAVKEEKCLEVETVKDCQGKSDAKQEEKKPEMIKVKVEEMEVTANFQDGDRTETDEVDSKAVIRDCKTDDNKKTAPTKVKRGLESIVANLLTSRKSVLAKLKASSSPKLDSMLHQHVSPRKRILREFERVSLDDAQSSLMSPASLKRHRTKTNSNGVSSLTTAQNNGNHHHPRTNSLQGPIHSNTFFVPSTITSSNSLNSGSNSKVANGSCHKEPSSPSSNSSPAVNRPPPPNPLPQKSSLNVTSKPISSYSIISLLSHNSSSEQQALSSSHHPNSESASKSPMDIQVYNKSLPPKKKLSPPHGSWSPKVASPSNAALSNSTARHLASSSPNNETPISLINYNLMRSPELSPSPEHGSNSSSVSRYKSHYGLPHGVPNSSASPYHPYLNVSMRGSPSETMSSASSNTTTDGGGLSNRYRSSPQYIREGRTGSSVSPNARYSPIARDYERKSSSMSRNQLESPSRSNSSPLSHHPEQPKKNLRSPSPVHHAYRPNPSEMPMDSSRLSIEEAAELKSKEEMIKHQFELERYAKSMYGHSSGAMPHPHLLPSFDLAEHHANLIRPPAALMSSLQHAYFLYPPAPPPPPPHHSSSSVPNGAGGGPSAQPPSPYLPSVPYYPPAMTSYMAAAAAAASYRNPALWYSPPHSNRLAAAHSAILSTYNASTMAAAAHAAAAAEMGAAQLSPTTKMYGAIPMTRDAMDQSKDDLDVPLNLSKH